MPLLQCAALEAFTVYGTTAPANAIYQTGPFDVAATPWARAHCDGACVRGGVPLVVRARGSVNDCCDVFWHEHEFWTRARTLCHAGKCSPDPSVPHRSLAAVDAKGGADTGTTGTKPDRKNAVNDDLRHYRVCTIACAVHIVDPKWHNLVGSLG